MLRKGEPKLERLLDKPVNHTDLLPTVCPAQGFLNVRELALAAMH